MTEDNVFFPLAVAVLAIGAAAFAAETAGALAAILVFAAIVSPLLPPALEN